MGGRCALYRPDGDATNILQFGCKLHADIAYLGDDASYTTAATTTTTTTTTTTAPPVTPKPTPSTTCGKEPCVGRKEGDICQVYTGEGTQLAGRCILDAKKRLVRSLKESTLANICE